MKQKICDLENLSELFCKEFVVKNDSEQKDAFLIYFNQRCYAYINDCPHTGVNLNWQEGQFLSVDGLFIQCSLHGALFEPDSGKCIYGPCRGQSLKTLKLKVENGVVYLSGESGFVLM